MLTAQLRLLPKVSCRWKRASAADLAATVVTAVAAERPSIAARRWSVGPAARALIRATVAAFARAAVVAGKGSNPAGGPTPGSGCCAGSGDSSGCRSSDVPFVPAECLKPFGTGLGGRKSVVYCCWGPASTSASACSACWRAGGGRYGSTPASQMSTNHAWLQLYWCSERCKDDQQQIEADETPPSLVRPGLTVITKSALDILL